MTSVLIVDDRDDNLDYLRALLEAKGFKVDAARNGVEALERARGAKPDLVVSDLLMPEMDGYTLLRRWKADAELNQVPFVVYTATYLASEDEELAISLGADAFIAKPAEPDEFLAKLEAARCRPVATVTPQHAMRESEESELLRRYSDTLVRKLDEKTVELEAANQRLREDARVRELADQQRRENEALLRLAGQAARLGGWSLDLATMRPRWSDQVCEIHEVTVGTTPTLTQAMDFYLPEHRETVSAAIDACVKNGTPFDAEVQIFTAKGRRLWIRTVGQAEHDATGKVVRIHGAFQDIDDRHKLENQYRQAQKMEVVGRLAGGIAHDFNNLLTIINGYTELAIQDMAPDDPAHEMLHAIRKAGDRSAGLTRQLLAFSRQEVSIPQVLNINETVHNVEKMLRRIIGEDVRLSTALDPGLASVKLDPGQLEQVIMNLAVNARDAMPTGGMLTIETRNVDLDDEYVQRHAHTRPGRHVLLAISDTGCGIPPEVRDRIFEPFFTTKPSGSGTGLGLSTVHGIVAQHGGHIQVYSEVGVGTTFKIYWPALVDLAVAQKPEAKQQAPRGTETVLLVEDDDVVRSFTRLTLTRCGYDVLEAASADEALQIAQSERKPIPLLVTDVVMPKMGGRLLAEKLLEHMPTLKVLYVSGYTSDAVVRHGILHNEINFLQKPFTALSLAQKIREILDN